MLKKRVLVVDDEPDIRELLSITLEQMGLEVVTAAKLSKAQKLLEAESFDLCLTDMKMPDGNGLDLVESVQQQSPQMPIAMITAYGNMDIAIEALKKGAFDFISKPLELIRLRNVVQAALKLDPPTHELRSESVTLIGKSQPVENLKQQIRQVARSQAPVFISGESGSGKEVVARAIHQLGPRANGPFIPVNCGAIPSELMESEFFGHKKGSFTGAHQEKQGLFQAAHGGTLLLDEVADLPLPMQVKLLRAIQEKSVRPVGAEEEIPVDIRILSATHKNLPQEVRNGQFRQDLFYRINVIELKVPNLRERAEDIPLLAEHFLKKFSEGMEASPPQITEDAILALTHHPFPGNIRELENTLERAYTLSSGGIIDTAILQLNNCNTATLSKENTNQSSEYDPRLYDSLDDYLAEIEINILAAALEKNRWNKTATAEELGISFRQIRHKLKKYGIE
ncbi:MAG: sigma-54-dependent Fis family transcriptional regulator [Gammaproteobacteria bacterium]|nr:MAG: sigma-54-dependent Fis family transcriptional regulator [Gammaproteobacteria bacterium]